MAVEFNLKDRNKNKLIIKAHTVEWTIFSTILKKRGDIAKDKVFKQIGIIFKILGISSIRVEKN